MKVQGFTPCYRLEPETVEAVLSLRWPDPLEWNFQWDNPYGEGRLNILHQYEKGRERFLAGDDEALLIVESDIIPPPEALEKLAALDCDVAYGVYRFRTTNIINVFERYATRGTPRNEGESLSLQPAKLRQAVRAGRVACSGGGLGCVLVRRRVLKKIPFRLEETAYCDTYFNRDVLRSGFSQVAEMSVICGHKTEYGEILWPRLS